MLCTLTSKLWYEGNDLYSKSHYLGIKNAANCTVYKKAVEQFGEQNVEATYRFVCEEYAALNANATGLLRRFGFYHEDITLLIHWDKVTVTNEEDRSTEIKDLFCKLVFRDACYKSMHFLRTTFTQAEWDAKYSHSHLHQINHDNPVSWGRMCLGSGPINSTIDTLFEPGYAEETLDVFFWELDKVVHVESLRGVPYIRMETLGNNVTNRADLSFGRINVNSALRNFMQSFFAAVKIPLGYEGGQYVCGCTFMDFALLVTNYWNKYEKVFRNASLDTNIYKETYVLKDSAIYLNDARAHDYKWKRLNPEAQSITFKGTPYKLTVTSTDGESCTKQLVYLPIVKYIQRAYLALVNMKFSKSNYGKKEKERKYDKDVYSLYTSSGVCSVSTQYGADTKDSFLFL